MQLTNKHELTQLKWEIDSLIGIVKELTGEKPSTEINSGQNNRGFSSLVWGIKRHLEALEVDFKK